ncbi:MAG: ABC transporter substrate-binding protein [Phycisphaerae bacterium]
MKSIRAILLLSVFALAAFVGSCRSESSAPQPDGPRVITLSPALTNIAFEIGVGGNIVGVSNYCRLPEDEPSRPAVGDARSVQTEAIASLRPDVILAQQQPRLFDTIRRVLPDVQIVQVTIETLPDIASAAEKVGKAAGNPTAGSKAAQRFRDRLASVQQQTDALDAPRVLFLMGYERPFAIGAGTFIDQMIRVAGGTNPAAEFTRYVRISSENIVAARPDVLICQVDADDIPAAEAYFEQLTDVPAVRNGRVHVVSDRGWTIPSLRLAELTERLAAIIHPQLRPAEDTK